METTTKQRVFNWTLGDRLGKALRNEHVSKQAMADLLGVTRNTVGNYIADRTPITDGYIRLWAVRTGLSFEELKYGDDFEPDPSDYFAVVSNLATKRATKTRPDNPTASTHPRGRAA